MRRILFKTRIALGGAVWGGLLGAAVGALAGAVVGIICRDLSLGLDGALVGGSLGIFFGTLYGSFVAYHDNAAEAAEDTLLPRSLLPPTEPCAAAPSHESSTTGRGEAPEGPTTAMSQVTEPVRR